mgnify:CR=1 FL=1
MSEQTPSAVGGNGLHSDLEDFAQQIADQVESFLLALRAIAREGNGAEAVSLLLLEISQVLLAGARLGAQRDFEPRDRSVPLVGASRPCHAVEGKVVRTRGAVQPGQHVHRDAAEPGLEAHQPAAGRRDADRAHPVVAVRDGHRPAGDRSGAAARRRTRR